LRDVCDLAYVLVLEQLERQYIADRSALASAAYASGQEVTLPAWDDWVSEFDEHLSAPPKPVTEQEQKTNFWRRELGLA
jgi:hypothetical protein